MDIQNPHEERQTVLLERINKNTAKTIELMGEVNHCIADLYRANENIRAAASLVDKYRRNVRYNIANAEAAAEPAGPRPSSRMQD